MQVATVITSEGKTRYMLLDSNMEPIQPVNQYIKFKDNSGSARNTLRSYCHHLKLYFEFLEQKRLNYRDVNIDDMAEFLRWLQNPYGNFKVASITPTKPIRRAGTCNIIISVVLGFYDYLMRHEDYSIQLSERLKRSISGSRRGYKDFLYHVNRNKKYTAKILKLKEPRKDHLKILTKEQVNQIVDACVNLRDKFLITLLWETGMRIGEALALWLENFEVDTRVVHIEDRGELINGAEIKTVCSPRSIDISSDLMNMFLDYVAQYHTDDVDTNHCFIKLSGLNKYEPLEYQDITSLFKRLQHKTGIQWLHPHILRHSSLDSLRRAGWEPEKVQKRAGHAQVQTTMNVYFHVADEELHDQWVKTEKQIKLNRKQGELIDS